MKATIKKTSMFIGFTAAIFAFAIMANRSINYSLFHPESDYIRYSNPTRDDLPLAYIPIWIYSHIFGHKIGPSLLGLTIGTLFLSFFMYKFYKENRIAMFSIFPLLFIGNLGMRQQLMGNLRSLMGFSIIAFGSFYKVDPLIILASSLTYFPSTVYYVAYKTIKRDNLKQVYIAFILALVIGICFSWTNEPWQSNFLKTIQIITPFSITNHYYTRDKVIANPQFYGWISYVINSMTIPIMGAYDYINSRQKETLIWTLLYLLPFIPYRGLWLSKRLMWISWLPSTMIFYHSKENIYKTICVFFLAFYFVRIFNAPHCKDLDFITNFLGVAK